MIFQTFWLFLPSSSVTQWSELCNLSCTNKRKYLLTPRGLLKGRFILLITTKTPDSSKTILVLTHGNAKLLKAHSFSRAVGPLRIYSCLFTGRRIPSEFITRSARRVRKFIQRDGLEQKLSWKQMSFLKRGNKHERD